MDVRAAINFANWLSLEHPKLFRQAAERADLAMELRNARAGNRGLGIIDVEPAPTEKTGWLDTFFENRFRSRHDLPGFKKPAGSTENKSRTGANRIRPNQC